MQNRASLWLGFVTVLELRPIFLRSFQQSFSDFAVCRLGGESFGAVGLLLEGVPGHGWPTRPTTR